MPYFSIVTVCYNSEKTIARTIESVLRQDFKDYEYIIVDGGSKDGTISIIKKYQILFNDKMKWKSESDEGIYDAFNKGISRSIGDYIWIVNSDDFIVSDALSIVKKYIESNAFASPPIISGAQNFWNEKNGEVIGVERKDKERGRFCYRYDLTGFTHPATLIPKSVYNTIGIYDKRFVINGDCDLFHRAYSQGVPFLYIPEVLTNMSDGGISGRWNFKRFIITMQDGRLYFQKNYNNTIVRYSKFLLWTLIMIRLYIKKTLIK